jgi:hypothetical protein
MDQSLTSLSCSWRERDERVRRERVVGRYESKVAGLLPRAYPWGLVSNAGARDEYTNMYSVAKRGDGYILGHDQRLRVLARLWATLGLPPIWLSVLRIDIDQLDHEVAVGPRRQGKQVGREPAGDRERAIERTPTAAMRNATLTTVPSRE